jgi:hypothetical protein
VLYGLSVAQREVEETFACSEDEALVPPVAQDLTGAFLQELLKAVTATLSGGDKALAEFVHDLFRGESSNDDWTPLPKRPPRTRPTTSVSPLPPTSPRLPNGKLPSGKILNFISRFSHSYRGPATS